VKIRNTDKLKRLRQRHHKIVIRRLDWWRGCSQLFYDIVIESMVVEAERVIAYVFSEFDVLPWRVSPHHTNEIRLGYKLKDEQSVTFYIRSKEFLALIDRGPEYKLRESVPGSDDVLFTIDRIHNTFVFVD